MMKFLGTLAILIATLLSSGCSAIATCPPGYKLTAVICVPDNDAQLNRQKGSVQNNIKSPEQLKTEIALEEEQNNKRIAIHQQELKLLCGSNEEEFCVTKAENLLLSRSEDDIELSISILQLTCRSTNSKGCRLLGNIYNTDKYIKSDKSKALFSFKLGCDSQDAMSCERYLTSLDVKSIGVDKSKIFSYSNMGCNNGFPVSCFYLGYSYENGFGTHPDKKLALQFYEKACNLNQSNQKGELSGCVQTAQLYIDKSSKAFNPTKGIGLLEEACNLNSAESCVQLGAIYIDNIIIDQNPAKALFFAQKSCSMKNTHGCSIAKHIERSLENNRLRQSEIQRKRDDDTRRAQEDRERERCLSNGPVGVCFKWVDSPRINVCNNGDLGTIIDFVNAINPLEYSQCYVRDTNSIAVYATVRNNHPYTIKDLKISCQMSAESGTSLGGGSETFLKLFPPGKQVDVQFKIFRRNQVNTLSCKSTSWRQ
jgi:TPR repeat protein